MTNDTLLQTFEDARLGGKAEQEKIFKEFYRKLVWYAQSKLRITPRAARARGPEDIVNSALASMFCKSRNWRQFDDDSELIGFLFVKVYYRVLGLLRKEKSIKRGGGKVNNENDNQLEIPIASKEEIHDILDSIFNGSKLNDTEKEIAWYMLSGFSGNEIAAELGVTASAISRKKRSLRDKLRFILE